jgi:3-isopropylmalate/(R)-2-methylmalate dehydratase small subunit
MMGLPCFVAAPESIDRLQTLIEHTPEVTISTDVASGRIVAGDVTFTATLPAAVRDGFLSGQWNPTAMLLERFDEVRAVAARLPYVTGFSQR